MNTQKDRLRTFIDNLMGFLDPYGENPCYIMGALMGWQTETIASLIR